MINIANATRALKMPNGSEYEFFGRTYYGTCSTAANTQTKTVNITGFTSASLTTGVKITVKFSNAQLYNGIPKLNVSSTGDKYIYVVNGTAANYGEWVAGEILDLIYDGTYWVIENSSHATTTYWGKTKLNTSLDSTDSSTAATPRSVYYSQRLVMETQWMGETDSPTVIVDTTTPAIEGWTANGNDTYDYGISDLDVDLNLYISKNRIIKTTFGDAIYYCQLGFNETIEYCDLAIDSDLRIYIGTVVNYNDSIHINASSELAGAKKFKVEFFQHTGAGFVSYPLLKDTLSNYLTLADLPIYDGTVV